MLFLLQLCHKELCHLTKQVVACVATIDSVVTVGVEQFAEILVCLNQSFRIFVHVLRMNVVVGCSMTEKQS